MRFAIASDRQSIDSTGIKYDLSDFDGYATEVALRLNEQQGPGEIVAVSLGPEGTQEILRKALSLGADRGVHLAADAIPFDSLAIAPAVPPQLEATGSGLVP